jgi:cupin 2 domain-containing protein
MMNNKLKNIFQQIPAELKDELVEVLLQTRDISIERIVSRGQASPPGFWYDQDRNEYVILIRGSAGLLFDGKDEINIMSPGDCVNIPAHVRHRVEWTDPSQDTVWLAVFY